MPGSAASYAYDGTNVIIETIREVGVDRWDIIKYISGVRHEGVTGTIKFDKNGNRITDIKFIEKKNGTGNPE
jgi:ABC-type branched-subunit amino acid transport system substrate-binding protein